MSMSQCIRISCIGDGAPPPLPPLPQTSLSDAVMAARAQLVELDLSDNAFGPTGIEAIFQLLSGPACFSLKILKLNNTGMGPQGGEVREYSLSSILFFMFCVSTR